MQLLRESNQERREWNHGAPFTVGSVIQDMNIKVQGQPFEIVTSNCVVNLYTEDLAFGKLTRCSESFTLCTRKQISGHRSKWSPQLCVCTAGSRVKPLLNIITYTDSRTAMTVTSSILLFRQSNHGSVMAICAVIHCRNIKVVSWTVGERYH